ncbi:MAG: hypothetical protein Q4G69_07155 [Planctomycetia bacterium]|nr:hypothetical protein [Planctomycetia bacterium]
MLFYKAFINEQDIENYTRSLILPSYMAYLTMDPFHFADQMYNANGRESLIVSYSGEGRLEEVALDPETHASAILRESHFGIDLSKVLLPEDSCWNWSGNSERKDQKIMNLFFLPRDPFLGYESKEIFAARDAYISVSRQELFLSRKIIREYLMERLRAILFPDSPYMLILANDDPEEAKMSSSDQFSRYEDSEEDGEEEKTDGGSRFSLNTAPDGFRFTIGKLEGSFTIDSPEIFRDLLQFAHLERAYKMIEEYIHFDWTNAIPRTEEEGLFFYPKEKDDQPFDEENLSD